MTRLWLDLETFSPIDIKAGAYVYATKAEILLFAYAIDDGPSKVWDKANEPNRAPHELLRAFNDPMVELVAHNAQFDRVILDATDAKTDIGRWRCTMAQAQAHGFPGSLDRLGRILGLPEDKAKSSEGKKLINRFCKPAPANHKADRYTKETHPEEWARFVEYARRDIDAMREVHKRLPDWNYRGDELELWRLDQKINDRGFAVDRELVKAGAEAADAEKTALTERFQELTGGAVAKPTQRAKFQEYLNEAFGLELEDTRSSTFQLLMKEPLHSDCRELMELSMMANKTSTAKYKTLLPAIGKDDRFRGGLQFAGAARTRRWAGRTFQPHNLPSRGLPPQKAVERYIDALKLGCHDFLFDNLMLHGSAALRGVLVAPEGRKLVVSDLSNIEGRVNAWLAGETWKLEAFEAFDRGEGPDLYNVTAGQLLGKSPYDIDKTERNVLGKVPELALGYEGGVGAFQTFSQAYGVQMVDHWPTIQRTLGREAVDRAYFNWDKWGEARNDGVVEKTEWLASETVKLAWRARHPAIVELWAACRDAATMALENRGKTFTAGSHLKFKAVIYGGWLYLLMRLPSGNFLVYFDPKISETDGTLTYMGVDPLTSQWARTHTYGGKLVENACQSFARDVLAHSMPKIEAAGYQMLLTVHDEDVTEAPDEPEFNADHLSSILATNPPWAQGLPLAAAGFEADRYRKD